MNITKRKTCTVKTKNYLIIVLVVSALGFSAGFYLKYVKSYFGVKLQVKTTSFTGKNIQQRPKLGETIELLKELESVAESGKSNIPKMKGL